MTGRHPRPAPILLLLAAVLAAPRRAEAGADTWTGNGPGGRRQVRTIAYAGGGVPTIFVSFNASATVSGTPAWIARSTDNGVSWTAGTGLPVDAYTNAAGIAVSPTNPATVYAAVQEYNSADIGKSTDGGLTWVSTGSPSLQVDYPASVAVSPTNAANVLAGTWGGVYWSTNGGSTWHAPTAMFGLASALAYDPTNPLVVYLGRNGTAFPVWKSTDGGQTFAPPAGEAGLPAKRVLSLLVDPSNPSIVYAGLQGGGLYKSTNGGGDTWTQSAGLPSVAVKTLHVPPDALGTIVAVTPWALWSSTDHAVTWTQLWPLAPTAPIDGLAGAAGPLANLFVGTFAGVERSTDGGANFAPLPSLTADALSQVWVVRGDPASTSTFYAGTYSGLFRTTDDGMTWSDMTGNLPSTAASFINGFFIPPQVPNVQIVSTGQGVYRSTDSGASFVSSSFSGGRISGDPFQPNTIYAAGNGNVWISTDAGATWTSTGSGLPAAALDFVAADPTAQVAGKTVLFAGTQFPGGLYKSTDGGTSWNVVSGFPSPSNWVFALAVDPFNNQNLFAAPSALPSSGYELQMSTDAGQSWMPVDVGNENVPGGPFMINEIVADPLTQGTIWVAADNGLFRTTNGGATWAPVTTGLPAGSAAQSFELHPGDFKRFVIANVTVGGGWSFNSNPAGTLVAGGGNFSNQASINSSWTPTNGNTAATYDPSNSSGSGGAGSAQVGISGSGPVAPSPGHGASAAPTVAPTVGGVQQGCLPVDPRFTYQLTGKILIPTGQTTTGTGNLAVSWFSDAACSAPSAITPVSSSPAVTATGLPWNDSALPGLQPPADAIRGRIGLAVSRNETSGTFLVNFDVPSLTITCDAPTATVSGGGAVCTGASVTIQAALTGLAPWSVTWSDSALQTNVMTSPVTRTFPASASASYTVTSVTDAYASCPGTPSGSANVTIGSCAGPSIVSLSLAEGSTDGGTPITISGLNFLTGATVKIGNAFCSGVVVNSASSISTTTPGPVSPGLVDVVVRNPDAQFDTRGNGFRYVRRGDANGDDSVDPLDIIYLINNLYAGGPPPP